MTTPPEEPGFRVTLKDVYVEVQGIKSILDERLRKIEQQVAAQWVVVGIVIVALGGITIKAFAG